MKLFAKLSVAFLMISSLVLIVGMVATNTSQKALEQVIAEKYILLAEVSLNDIDRAFSRYITDFQMLAKDPLVQNLAKESNQSFDQITDIQKFIDKEEEVWVFVMELNLTNSIRKLINNPASVKLKERMAFHQLISGLNLSSNIFITNKYGGTIALTKITPNYYYGDKNWWIKARDNDLWVGDVSYDKDLNVYSTDISIKIKDEEGEFLGVMHVIWDIAEVIKTVESLKESLTSGLSIEKNKKAYAPKYSLLTADSKTIYSSEKQITLKNETDKKLSDMVSEKSGYHIMKSDVPGEEVLFAYARSKNFGNHKGLDWIILVEHKTSNIFKMITRIKRTIMFISVLGLCLALIIGFFIASSIFNPIKKLQDAVALIGKGDMNVDIDIDSRKGEVGALAASFKKMIVDLKKTTTSVNRLNEEIVERKRMENTLRESEERFKDLFENARDLIMLVNLEGRITAVNKIVREYGFRKEDLINKNILVFISPKNQQQAIDDLEKIKAGIIAKGEMEMVTPKGGLSIEYCNNPILKANKIVGAQSIMRDISSRKEMENVQRLTQLGKFVAAMAHEVNNPLMIISGNAQIALMEPFENEEVKKNLEVVFKECQRAKDIINRLLKFSKPSKKTKADTDANVVIEETVKLLEHQFSLDGVTINRSYTPGLPLISFDSKQLQEVLMNLLTNARDAILPEKGKIEVITLTEGSRVKIKVKDSGKGMDEKVMANIFQPFFTTKEKGTGLGLAVCYSLVHDAGGELKFESKPREGTTALIIVPVLPNNA